MSLSLITIPEPALRGPKPSVALWPNVWMAGGAVRQWFTGDEEKSDVDLFCSAALKKEDFVKQSGDRFGNAVSEHQHATTYKFNDQLIQAITIKQHATISELVDSFDFTVCQFVWDGSQVYATPLALISVLRKHLAVHKINPEFASDSLRRAFKYQRKGFSPCNGTIIDLAQIFVKMTDEQIRAQVEISPGGGSRTIRFD